MNILFDKPNGELLIFYKEAEVKEFWSRLGLEPEELKQYGVFVAFDEDSEEYVCDIIDAYVAPLFDTNPYLTRDEKCYSVQSNEPSYRVDNLSLDKEVYCEYPMVGYVWIEDDFSRAGDQKIGVFNVQPLSELTSLKDMDEVIDKYHDTWLKNYNDRLEWEALRDRQTLEESK